MIPTATSRIDGIAILQHHDGQPVVRTYRTTAKGKGVISQNAQSVYSVALSADRRTE